LLFSRALCIYSFNLKPDIKELLRKANQFIKKMRKDSDYWNDYPLFEASGLKIQDPGESDCRKKISTLSLGARLHLFRAISYGESGISLPHSTDYATRSFGLNIDETTKEILDNGLLISSEDPLGLLSSFSRNGLLELCQKKNADFRKSWNKDKLLSALIKADPEFVQATLKEKTIVSINPEYKDDLLSINSHINSLENIYKLLCFV